MNDDMPLDSVLSAAVRSDELQALLAEYAEVGIDALLKEGVGRDIPAVGTFLAAIRVGGIVRDRMFAKKLFAFLGPLRDVPPDERAAMVSRLEADSDYGRKVGEHLLGLLDRIDDHKKPAMLARIFVGYVRGEIDAVMLHRLTHAIERLPAFEIPALRLMHMRDVQRTPHPASIANLVAAGLLNTGMSSAIGGGRLIHHTSVVGDAFIKLELDLLPQ
jgi:hypothetical protein